MNFSTISSTLIQNISTYYNFEQVNVLKKLGGVGTSNFIIKADSSYLFLKLYDHCDENRIYKLEEITHFLSSKGIPVIFPIKNKHGSYHTFQNNIIFSLYPRIYGNVPPRLISKSLTSITNVIFNFHKLGEECPLEFDHTINTLAPISQLIDKLLKVESLINQQPLDLSIKGLSQELITMKIDILNRFDLESLKLPVLGKKSLVHGDFHIENLLFDSDQQVIYILDFDCVHYGHGIEDIILFILYRLFNSHYAKQVFEDAKHFLALYSQHCPLDISEIKFGVNYALFKIASSIFLEEKLCQTKHSNLTKHFEWNLKNILYLYNNKEHIIDQSNN